MQQYLMTIKQNFFRMVCMYLLSSEKQTSRTLITTLRATSSLISDLLSKGGNYVLIARTESD